MKQLAAFLLHTRSDDPHDTPRPERGPHQLDQQGGSKKPHLSPPPLPIPLPLPPIHNVDYGNDDAPYTMVSADYTAPLTPSLPSDEWVPNVSYREVLTYCL